jgi:hypothetical protein
MANVVSVAFVQVGLVQNNCPVPIIKGTSGIVSETITSSASNQQSAASSGKSVARVATDTAIYVAVGSAPDATTATARVYMPANSVEYIQLSEGHKVAVVNA